MSDDMHDDMGTDPLERQLRAALKPRDPPEGFAAGVMARVAAEPAAPLHARRPAPAVAGWLGFGLAASVVLAVLLAHQWQVRRIEQGREARRQLLEALRVTDEKLDLTYRVVNAQPRAALPPQSGA